MTNVYSSGIVQISKKEQLYFSPYSMLYTTKEHLPFDVRFSLESEGPYQVYPFLILQPILVRNFVICMKQKIITLVCNRCLLWMDHKQISFMCFNLVLIKY